MKRVPVTVDPLQFPPNFRPLLSSCRVYDSSCSPDARVWYLQGKEQFYLKSAPKGALETEAAMTGFFHRKGLAAQVFAYESHNRDWLLTACLPGEDCIWPGHLEAPKRLSETLGILLRQLHETDSTGCPIPNHRDQYLATAERNRQTGLYHPLSLPEGHRFSSAEEAWATAQAGKFWLRQDTLLHGDYCLPNILLDRWQFSGFIDLDHGGIGDRHVDLFWGWWSLWYNLKDQRWSERFLDAYGREAMEPEMLRVIAAFEHFG